MTDFRGQTDNESLRPDVLLKRIEAEIQSVRDILISAFHTEMDDWDVLCFEEPPSMLLLRQLSRLLADEANTIALHVQDQESEIESLRAAIEVEGANVRRESWRRSARERILAGENPDALPMDADMTFAEYFAQVRTLLAELARNKPARLGGDRHAVACRYVDSARRDACTSTNQRQNRTLTHTRTLNSPRI